MSEEKPRKLTPRDLAFGIGRKATEEELRELLSRDPGPFKDSKQLRTDLKKKLEDRRSKRKAS